MAGPPPKPVRRTVPIGSLVPNPRNAKQHPEHQIAALVESIRANGQPRPVLVRAANKMLIAGHGVWLAMQAAGKRDIVADLWDVDQAVADRFMIADNRLPELGVNDPGRMLEVLRSLEPGDWAGMGFLDEDVEALDPLQGLHGEPEIQEIDADDLELDFIILVRGPIRRQPEALQKLQQFMGEFPEVTVRLMTDMTEEAEFV